MGLLLIYARPTLFVLGPFGAMAGNPQAPVSAFN
jgi:hypothetical protein